MKKYLTENFIFCVVEFAKSRALRAFLPYEPSRLTRLHALRVLVPYVPWFLRALITRLTHSRYKISS